MASKESLLMQLDDTYRITSDKYNYILERLEDTIDIVTKEYTGNFKWKIIGYYGTKLTHALNRYITESVSEVGISDVKSVLNKLESLSKQIDQVVKKENIQFITKEDE